MLNGLAHWILKLICCQQKSLRRLASTHSIIAESLISIAELKVVVCKCVDARLNGSVCFGLQK